jgi:hypothetical protein
MSLPTFLVAEPPKEALASERLLAFARSVTKRNVSKTEPVFRRCGKRKLYDVVYF